MKGDFSICRDCGATFLPTADRTGQCRVCETEDDPEIDECCHCGYRAKTGFTFRFGNFYCSRCRDRPPDPTPEAIRAAAEAIRAEWTAEVRAAAQRGERRDHDPPAP